VRTAHARITVHLPGLSSSTPVEQPCVPASYQGPGRSGPTVPLTAHQVRAWGLGPLQGQVTIPNPQTVVLDITHLKPFQFVEASILFPKAAVPLEGSTSPGYGPDLSKGPLESASQVLAQEIAAAKHANTVRVRLRVVDWLWRWLALLFPPFLLAMLIGAYRRDRVRGIPRTLQEPPETIHPVDLAAMWGAWHHGLLTMQNAYRAELLHLAKEGVIEVRAEGRVSKPDDIDLLLKNLPSHPYDQEFTEYLFADEGVGPIKLSKIKATGKRLEPLRTWTKTVGNRVERQREKRGRRWEAPAMFWAMDTLAVVAIVAAIVLHRLGVVWLLVEAVLLWATARALLPPRLPDDAREQVQRWAAFRRFLKRFSSLPDAPALAVIIWEDYLAYATALGVAEVVAKQVKAVIPEEELSAAWPGASPGLAGFSWAYTMAAQAPASAASTFSTISSSGTSWTGSGGSFSSSSGFSGGGFSSGGGGGGGGGAG
jgi:uncharacterized membrane protein YgcG